MKCIIVRDKEGYTSRTKKWNIRILSAKTKKKCIDDTKALFLSKTKKEIQSAYRASVKNIIFKRHNWKLVKIFEKIFGFTMPKCIIGYALGRGMKLDVINLDKILHTPDGTSTHDFILSKYGKLGTRICKALM